ncbi:hypothetical protein ACFFUT_17110 [Pseudohalocynthiibacter aestuariivivens]|uniref:Uncharacterized protein n=1 Tax=Pseudohalocynthiibacter aestuariivivens TaxID=1591409 RepID=A0ABV5JJ84_9RHOB|nr:hypothetical protein [Pseudohalocynthiibacter aestuariivivens]MBS9716744.1 hypothetical protein [Pseudohalocynthiibacter aestuariivivens]
MNGFFSSMIELTGYTDKPMRETVAEKSARIRRQRGQIARESLPAKIFSKLVA